MISSNIYIKKPGEVRFLEEEINDITPGVICKTIFTAISPGTEISAYMGDPPLRPGVEYPRLVGYCNVAEIINVDKEISNFDVGDRVLSFVSHRSLFKISEDEILAKIPKEVSSESASTSYLYHLGYQGVLACDLKAGSNLLVIGLGCLGLTTIKMSTIAGCNVFGVSDYELASDNGSKMGARQIFQRDELLESLESANNNIFDCVIVATNHWNDVSLALQACNQRGKIGFLGFPGRNKELPTFNPFEPELFYSKQLQFISMGLSPEKKDQRNFLRFNEKDNLAYILDLMDTKKIKYEEIITATFKADKIEDAYKYIIDKNNSPITCLLDWQ